MIYSGVVGYTFIASVRANIYINETQYNSACH